MTPQPNQRWNGPIRKKTIVRQPRQPVLCPRDLRVCKLVDGRWVCDRHGPLPEAA